jgi:hypothetical protein
MSSFNENTEHSARDAARKLTLQSVKQDSSKNRASQRIAQAWRHWVQYCVLLHFPARHHFYVAIRLRQRTRSPARQLDVNCFTSRKHCAQLSGAATKIQVIATLSAELKDCKAPAMMHSSPLSFLKTTVLE